MAGRSCGAFATATRNDPVLLDSENLQPQMRAPTPQNVTVRSPRPRDYLTEREVEKLMDAAKGNRHGTRDATMILVAFRHGLRASELCELQWSDVEFESGTLHLRRAKGGATGTHPLLGDDELRALRALNHRTFSVPPL